MYAFVRGWNAVAASLLSAGTILGCGGAGQFVWFDQLPPEQRAATTDYVISAGDTVSIRVLGHEDMNVHERVRPDGRLALLLIGEVEAKGKRPSALRAELEGRLKDYIVSPNILVTVDETSPLSVLMLGEVGKPGAVALEHDPRLAHAIALAGGLSDFASRDSIYVVRDGPPPMRIRFRYEAIRRNTAGAADFPLLPGDIVEVE